MSEIRSYKWQQIRKRVLSRDRNQCTQCGATEGQMQVDHILSRVQGGAMYDMDNLQTLCFPCHIEKTKQDAVFLSRTKTPPYRNQLFLSKNRAQPASETIKRIEGDFGTI